MKNEIQIIQEIPYEYTMNLDLVERWANIPFFSKNDVSHPEWRETPIRPMDLTDEGYGLVYVKDESDRRSNPTGTIKDRAAWELCALYRDFARNFYLAVKTGNVTSVQKVLVPRFSIITSGNVGVAVSQAFVKHGLPPMKILVDSSLSPEKIKKLEELYADIYQTDLKGKQLSSSEINAATRNEGGSDITSLMIFEPHAVFYDWHAHESFNFSPDSVFMPYGSGRLMENYLTWQFRNARQQDPRLRISIDQLAKMNILAAEPESRDSIADKLTKSFNPFVFLGGNDLQTVRNLLFSGQETGVYAVSEARINQAYELMQRKFDTEPSGSAGLALYLQRHDEGKVREGEKVLIVNTGRGNLS